MDVRHAIEPLLPDEEALRLLGDELRRRAGELGRHVHRDTLDAVAELLRTVNCYYSNLIEGHDTHPAAIERAMHAEYAADSPSRDLQLEALAHIAVQRELERRLAAEPTLAVYDVDTLRWIHREFYHRLPESLRVVRDPRSGREEPVVAGELRRFEVLVGRHHPPKPGELEPALRRFAEAYDPGRLDPREAVAAAGAAHHRLLWIHPFGDGNGRVARLAADAWLRRIGIGSIGLWSPSRGLARHRDRYREVLAGADAPRWDDYDGRGGRSRKALIEFCRFYLDTCLDQVGFMARLLEVDGLANRMRGYCRIREEGIAPDRHGGTAPATRFRPEMGRLLEALVYRGRAERADLPALLGLEERTARRVVRALLDDGFLVADSHRAPVRLRLPPHAAPFLFPAIFPTA